MPTNLPSDIEQDDVYQWLQDGWVLHEGNVWRFIGDVEYKRGEDEIYAVFRRNGDHEVLPVSRVELVWPTCGAINTEAEGISLAVYVNREQRRQWRRTFNDRCVNVLQLGAWGNSKRLVSPNRVTRITEELVEALFNPVYYTVNDAMRMIRGGALSVAVNPQVTVVGDGKGQFGMYYRHTLVGGIKHGVFTPTIRGGYACDMVERLAKEALDVI